MTENIIKSDLFDSPEFLPDQPTDHPLFQEIEAATERGDWTTAHQILAELISLYPNDKYLNDLEASIQARSALFDYAEPFVIEATQDTRLAAIRRFLIPVAIIIVVLLLAGGIFLMFQRWLLPQARAQRQETRISQLREEAEAALSSGDYDRTVLAYTELLELQPNDPEALQGLEQTRLMRVTLSRYSEAVAAMEAHHWADALSILEAIEQEQPGFRDVAQRIAFVQEQQTLSTQFEEAEAAFERGYYELAITKYEELQSTDSTFQRETVQDHLFYSYLQSGLIIVSEAGSDTDQLQTALIYFDQAQVLRPNDSQTRGESQLLRLYLSGRVAISDDNWDQAISDLSTVYEARSDFAGGTLNQLLYQTYLARGEELIANERYEQALNLYQEARLVRGIDTTELNQKIAQVELLLAPPTPTPEPTPTVPAPAPIVSSGNSSSGFAQTVPTETPVPLPYSLKDMQVRANCSGSGYIHGVVWSVYNLPMAGVTVQANNTTTGAGPFIANPTNDDGIYQIVLNEEQIPGLWVVQVFENGQPASDQWGQHLGGGCVNGVQELKVDWQRILVLE